jgi:hypothetical protein
MLVAKFDVPFYINPRSCLDATSLFFLHPSAGSALHSFQFLWQVLAVHSHTPFFSCFYSCPWVDVDRDLGPTFVVLYTHYTSSPQ